jgi:hypothetical protein
VAPQTTNYQLRVTHGHHALSSKEAHAVNNDPLYVSFYSIVVKRSAVTLNYPGGLKEFDRVLEPARSSDALSVVVRMSLADANLASVRLYEGGLTPGEDFGLYEMHNGALAPCNGVRVIEQASETGLFQSRTVVADPSYRYEQAAEHYTWQPPEAKVATEPAKDTGSSGPRRVVFGSGPVHWFFDDDEEDGE